MYYMTNKKYLLVFTLTVIFLLAFTFMAGGWKDTVQTRREYSGTIEATEVDVRAQIPGQVLKVPVEEGRQVKKGQLLAEIDAAEIRARKLQAEAKLLQARSALEKALAGAREEEIAAAQARADKAEAALDLARDTYDKIKALYEAGAVAEQKFIEAGTSLAAAEADYKAAQQNLALYRSGTRQEDIAAARGLVKEAEAAVKEAEAYLDKATVASPLNGAVTMRTVDAGDLVSPGYAMFTVTDMTKMWLTVYVPEDEIGGIAAGTRAAITFPAFPDRRFSGEVARVQKAPSFATRRSTDEQGEKDIVSFEVEIKVDSGDTQLLPGMTGYVTFKAGDA